MLVLHRDANLLILDKPAGIAVHRGPSGQPSLEDRLGELTFGLRHVPALAHRLDHDTSGCLVLARHPKALSRLGRLWGAGKVVKTYWAIASGRLTGESGTIDLALAKRNDPTGWRMVADPASQRAVTEWRVLGRDGERLWLELHPLTGRTHQIRVHLAALGCPILGDTAYGSADCGGKLLLHARRIEIPYWEGRPPVVAEAPPPAPFDAALSRMTEAVPCFR
jgi:RluA family pseudouridine synthase